MFSGSQVITRQLPTFKNALNWLRPKGHFDHATGEFAVLIGLGATLALGTTVAFAWAAGFGEVFHRLLHVRPLWIPLALAGQVVAYLGYMLAYREVARGERGPALGMMKLAAVVFTGLGVLVAHGGFSADLVALRRTGISKRDARVRVLGLGALEYAVLAPAVCICSAIILAHGSGKPGLGLTLPWAIAMPVGFAAAFWGLRYCDKWATRKGWRGALGHGLEAVAVLKHLLRQPPSHGTAFVGMALYWLGEIFSL